MNADQQTVEVFNTRWMPDGEVRARCLECGWSKRSDSQGAVVSAVRRHVLAERHKVEIYRSQWRLAEPVEADR